MATPAARKRSVAAKRRSKPASRTRRPSTFDVPPSPLPEGAIPSVQEINELRKIAERVRRGEEPLTYTKL